MNEQKAKEILEGHVEDDGTLYCLGHYMSWKPGFEKITLDSEFTVEELEAIVWWMRNKQ